MNMTYNEFKNSKYYDSFITKNNDYGLLKIMTYTAYQAIPIEGVLITITKEIDGNNVIIFKGLTDSSGIIDNIKLPAPKGGYSIKDYKINDYILYNISAEKEGYEKINKYTVGMYGNVKTIQQIKMIPLVNMENNNGSI